MSRRAALVLAASTLAAVPGCAGPASDAHQSAAEASWVNEWSRIAIDASGIDHAPVVPGLAGPTHQQLGPGRASRAMAIVHIAMFDAANAIASGFRGFSDLPPAPRDASLAAAIGQAAHDTLVALYPSQAPAIDDQLARFLAEHPQGAAAERDGIAVGAEAAAAVLADRDGDGSAAPEPVVGQDYFPDPAAGKWRPDPVSQGKLAMGAHWGEVRPFALTSGSELRVDPPPALDSSDYATAYDEVARLGGDGVTTPTERTAEQTLVGLYWAYDGTPSLCAPPRLYNQITAQLAHDRGLDGVELARLLALVNVAMADAGIAIWDSKYFYDVWRPVTGIRESDPGTGPMGLGDGNPLTAGDPGFMPLGAPASNADGPNFTPPFPSYPSGHAGFGGAVFEMLRLYFGTDDIAFSFVSDELDGVTVGNDGAVRPLVPRSFASLSQAEEENGQSRIYLGIHWSFDKTAGIAQGRKVADAIFDRLFQPVP